MCGVIVVDAESFRSTCRDVMPIYMIIPRYSHNYAQFYQLLDSNLFTHHNTYAILREATSQTYAPLIRLQRIYNFLSFHAILYPVLDINGVYYTLLYYFWD